MKKPILRTLLCVLSLFALLSPALAEDGDSVEKFILNDYYLKEHRKGEGALLEPVDVEVKFEDGSIAHNCAEYLENLKNSKVVDTTWNLIFDCRYEGCDHVASLLTAKPHKGYRPQSYIKEIYNRLDIDSFLNDFVYQDPDNPKTRTMSDLDSKLFTFKNNLKLEFEEPEVTWIGIDVKADADINGNGKPDWLIAYSDKALGGTAVSCRSLVIYDVEPTGLLKAEVHREKFGK